MNVDVEAGGALTTAALAAKAVDGHVETRGDGHAAACANCKATLSGAYCHACGQSAHVHRSLWHMIEEGLHGVLHFDSKTWRTLPLLIARPGVLTRRYIDGQRVRYVAPLPLFLFMIFLMFFVVSSVSDGPSNMRAATAEQRDARAALAAELAEAKALVGEREAELAAAADAEERADAAQELAEAQAEARSTEALLAILDKAAADAAQGKVTMELTPEELTALTGLDLSGKKSEVLKSAPSVLRKVKDNPELYLYKLKNTAYKFAFALIPISLPFLWLMFFWRRNVTMYDHMVFSMYSLSFMSLWFVIFILMTTTTVTARFVGWMLLVPPVHMFVHLRGTYALSKSSALWRTFALLASAGTVFVLFLVLIALISYV